MTFDVAFPDDDGGRAAAEVLPDAIARSHDRLCTVSRTVEIGTPVATSVADDGAAQTERWEWHARCGVRLCAEPWASRPSPRPQWPCIAQPLVDLSGQIHVPFERVTLGPMTEPSRQRHHCRRG